jgi:hypothetical protein
MNIAEYYEKCDEITEMIKVIKSAECHLDYDTKTKQIEILNKKISLIIENISISLPNLKQ